jgi:hypothetical protein
MAIRYSFSGYVPSDIQMVNRTRRAIQLIRALPVQPTQQKKILATWFQIHTRAAVRPGAKHRAYKELLGEFHRSRIQG